MTLTVADNDIEGGCVSAPAAQWTCGTNLDVDPAFESPATGDHALGSGSPVQDAGDDAHLPPDLADLDGDSDVAETLPLDRAGSARIAGSSVDIGTFERP